MADLSPDSLSEALRTEPRKRLARLLTSSTLLVVTLYVLGFIYLKTYLAVFGIQIELASLSLPNLVLAHRFFVAQHFFVGAGIFHSFLFSSFRIGAIMKRPISAVLLLISPATLLPIGWWLSAWSEENTPTGFNIAAPGLWLPFLIGWLMGLLSYGAARRVLQPLKDLRHALWYVGAIILVALTVFSYRLYASVLAADRLARNDLQILDEIRVGAGHDLGPCGVIYVDSEMFYLVCGTRREVVRKEAVDHYVVRH